MAALPCQRDGMMTRAISGSHPGAARKACRYLIPVDVLHEGIDIGGGLGAVVHVIGMLVHIQGQNGARSGQRMRMVGRPLVDEPVMSKKWSRDIQAASR